MNIKNIKTIDRDLEDIDDDDDDDDDDGGGVGWKTACSTVQGISSLQ